jgi:hypothetical protein
MIASSCCLWCGDVRSREEKQGFGVSRYGFSLCGANFIEPDLKVFIEGYFDDSFVSSHSIFLTVFPKVAC